MTITQNARPLTVSSPLGDDALILLSVKWNEVLGQPFQGELRLASETDSIDPMQLLRQSMTVCIGESGRKTKFSGYVCEFEETGFDAGLYGYRAILTPWIGLLGHVGGARIFQQKTAVEIAKLVIDERGFTAELEDRLTQNYRQRPYCVQYNESDLQFLSRLFEEEGIYYFFEHEDDRHTLVLCDDVGAHAPVEGLTTLPYRDIDPGRDICVSQWSSRRKFSTASYVMSDYDFQKPRANMTVRQNAVDTASEWNWYQFPGRYFETEAGQHYARVRSEAAIADQQTATLQISTHGLGCGNLLSIKEHPNVDVNQEQLVVTSTLSASASAGVTGASGSSYDISIQLAVQPSSLPFRTVPRSVRPTVQGPQIATVVGPAGEEIWTDQYGRIKVQFAWDQNGTNDDGSSCWIRVTQPWTGKGFGAVSIPRIGEEVVVEFLDGDVDRPIVTGRVFNADRMPPEGLSDGQAKTVFRTRSTKNGDVDCFHELTFDDTKDEEKIYFHSERDFERVVENNDSLKVGFDKSDGGDQTIEVFNDQQIQVGVGSGSGSQTVEIGQDRSVTIDAGDDNVLVNQGDRSVKAAQGSITIEAMTSITLKCGDSQIVISPSGITIQSDNVSVTGDTQVTVQSTEVDVNADAGLKLDSGATAELSSGGELTIKGAMVAIN